MAASMSKTKYRFPKGVKTEPYLYTVLFGILYRVPCCDFPVDDYHLPLVFLHHPHLQQHRSYLLFLAGTQVTQQSVLPLLQCPTQL
ncbi:hypothetical protein SLE2022_228720 [Rubroshorea leprosula]